VAKFFVYAVLGADHDSSPYTQTGERIAPIAAGGIRLVIDELRTDVTKTRKDGTPDGCATTTATTATRRPRSRGCGGSSYAEPRVMRSRGAASLVSATQPGERCGSVRHNPWAGLGVVLSSDRVI
jgi:hypothetical protein